jgi:hypothetical protein
MLYGTHRSGAAGWFAVLTAALAIVGGGFMTAGCTTSGQPALGPTAIGGSGLRTVAFESIDGPPEQLFRRLVSQLNQEATAHEIAMVSRESSAQFRIRGYVAAHVQGQKTTITWVWDVFDADRVRAVRLVGEVPGAPSERAWAAADDGVVTRMASDGMSRLAAFLANPASAPAEFPPPRDERSPNIASSPQTERSLAFLPQSRP